MKNNKQKNKEIVISVESRKGGVGKTTAALCMARLLLQNNYKVLFLDLDITGTNAADFESSLFWKENIFIIQEPTKQKTSQPVNLIELFDNTFMSGKPIPPFTMEKSCEDLQIDPTKVNIIGSQIYKINSKTDISIEHPGILFDDLYSFWLLEFIKRIIKNFVNISKFKKVAIILDNSPGYVGISPAIQEWLTDCGPDYSKFLFVTSLDPQDLHACGEATKSIHKLYQEKWDTRSIFINMSNKSKGKGKNSIIIKNKRQEAFFMRLATNFDSLPFYEDSLRQNTKGQIFCEHPSQYISTIINRVPRAIKTGDLAYNKSILAQLLFEGENEQVNREKMIFYDEYLEHQFFSQYLQQKRRISNGRFHKLIDTFETSERELRKVYRNENKLTSPFEIDIEHYGYFKQLATTNNIIIHALTEFDNAGLKYLSNLIHDEWLPTSIVPKFRRALEDMLRESEFPYFDSSATDWNNYQTHIFREDFRKHLHHIPEVEIENKQIADKFINLLSNIVFLSLPMHLWHSPFQKELFELFTAVIIFEIKHWVKREEKYTEKFNIARFLAQESISEKEMDMLGEYRFLRHYRMREENVSFVDFYKVCTSTQARLIDFREDSIFLLRLFHGMITYNEKGKEKGESVLFPFVKGIAEDVIVNKSVSHEEEQNRIAKAFQAAEYFKEFNAALKGVLKKWESVDE
ncbi:MAG: P-loop NTPase [bacterium]|nr:P-loop NTPase [bacterium]